MSKKFFVIRFTYKTTKSKIDWKDFYQLIRGNKGISNLIQKEIEKYSDQSFQKRFVTEDNLNSSINFSQVNKPMRIFLDKISSLNRIKNNLTIAEKVSEMNQWFTESFLNIVKEDESEGEIEEENESNISS